LNAGHASVNSMCGSGGVDALVAQAKTLLLSQGTPSARERRVAIAVGAALFIAFLGILPFKNRQVPLIEAFIPIVDSGLFLTDLITAAFLYAQHAAVPRRGLPILASGYLFTALIGISHLLVFPGALTSTGLLHANLQSPIWIYSFRYLGFPTALIAYALQKDKPTVYGERSAAAAPMLCVLAVAALVCALTWLATRDRALPTLLLDATHATWGWNYVVIPALLVAHLIAIAVLWRRGSSVVDLWLLLMLWAWFIELMLLSMTTSRLSLYYYAAVFGLVGSCFVLIVLLCESTILYARFAVVAGEREREGDRQRLAMQVLAGSIAHELKQPISAIVANSEVGRLLLTQTPPKLDEVSAAFHDITADARRAADTLTSIGAALAGAPQPKTLVNMGELVRETLALMRGELLAQDVFVQSDVSGEVVSVHGNAGQLRQVLVNLAANAVEAMLEVRDRPRTLRVRCGTCAPAAVSVSMEDCGPGIPTEHLPRLFDPFFTTKARGGGIGLALCKLIVENHGGTIAASRGTEHGSIFQVVLPAHNSELRPSEQPHAHVVGRHSLARTDSVETQTLPLGRLSDVRVR
jgi:signal transduction histidine kinase